MASVATLTDLCIFPVKQLNVSEMVSCWCIGLCSYLC